MRTGRVVLQGVCAVPGSDDLGFAHWRYRSEGGLYSDFQPKCTNPRPNRVASVQCRLRRESQCTNPSRHRVCSVQSRAVRTGRHVPTGVCAAPCSPVPWSWMEIPTVVSRSRPPRCTEAPGWLVCMTRGFTWGLPKCARYWGSPFVTTHHSPTLCAGSPVAWSVRAIPPSCRLR